MFLKRQYDSSIFDIRLIFSNKRQGARDKGRGARDERRGTRGEGQISPQPSAFNLFKSSPASAQSSSTPPSHTRNGFAQVGQIRNQKSEIRNKISRFISQFPLLTTLLLWTMVYGLWTPSQAQTLTGFVYEQDEKGKKIPLVGANVFWLESQTGTATDTDGKFSLKIPVPHEPLVVSYIGYENDTIHVHGSEPFEVRLMQAQTLSEVEVKGRKEGTIYSTTKTINQITLNEKELQKAACCNLSESFETEGSVDVMYRDGVTGAKEIQMLGLSGTYTQMLRENIPALRGLANAYGMAYIPGTWIQSIQISKGAGSVVNGYESMTGQINIELRKPLCDEPRFFLNVFGNSLGRSEGNLHLSKRFNDKVGSLLLLHGSNVAPKIDFNDDSFLDIPRTTQVNVYNRWETLFSEKVEMQTGFQAVYERRLAGQTFFNPDENIFTQDAYGVLLNTQRYEGFNKLGLLLNRDKKQSIGFIVNGLYHRQDGYYGRNIYDGTQKSFYANIIPQTEIGNEQHLLKTGVSFMYDDYDEVFGNLRMQRTEIVPGAFAEYHFDFKQKVSVLAGFRTDYHNLFGWQHTPRLHFKYNFTENTVFRISGGRGFRVPNVFIENTNILVSSRQLVVVENPQAEISWNAGTGIMHTFKIDGKDLTMGVEYYRTQFINQLIVDLDQHFAHAYIYNLDGKSFSNNIQADIKWEIVERLGLKITYKYNDVKTTYDGRLLPRMMVPRHNGLVNMGYETANEKWLFNATVHIWGKARLAHNNFTETGMEQNIFAPTFATLNAHITKKWKHIDWYVGGENITNYRQKNPIVDARNPFGSNFDAAMVWGPVIGAVVYTGIRWTIQ